MRKVKICDTHNDFLTELSVGEFTHYIDCAKKYGVDLICGSYWDTKRDEEKIKNEISERADFLKNRSNCVLHIEDLWWVKNEDDLRFLLNIKPFSCSLTWNAENCLAGGAKSRGGLSAWGKHCTEKLLEAGVLVDVAHLNRKSFWQVAEIVESKLYCSHTGFCGIKDHKRNLTGDQLDKIVGSGGFVGLFFFDDCIKKDDGKTFDVKDIVKNIGYFTSRWGFENLGIGSDFYGIEKYPEGLKDYSDFGNLENEMKKAGFNQNQIDKILSQNFKQFLKLV